MTWTAEQLEALERLRADYGADNAGAGDADEFTPLPPAPTWPAGITPAVVDAYAMAQARAIRVPPEMVFGPLLVSAGATIGNAVELELKPGWTVLPTLWVGLIALPGRKKTPAQLAGQWPANALQKRLYQQWQAAMAEYESDLQAWEARPKEERGEKPQPPLLDHLYTTDATMEALVGILSKGRGLTVFRDELAGLIGAMDKYRKGDDRQQWLSLWPGAPIKADRKGGGTVYATHPVVGVYGGIQPDLAGELHNRNGDRDGMVERFLLFRPDVHRSGWTDDAVDPALLGPVVDLFEALRSIRKRTIDDVGSDAERVTVKMHPDAKRLWVAWFNDNDEAAEHVSGLRAGFYSKLDSQLARVALILHCLHNASDPRQMLSATTMQAAIDVAEFFRGHLDRVLPLIGDHSTAEPVGLSARILRYLRTPELQDGDGWVRRSDLLHRLSNVPAPDLTTELSDLERRGIVESRTADGTTKPTELWRIRPTDHQMNQTYPNYSDPPAPPDRDSSDSSDSSDRASDDLNHCQRCGTDLPDDRDALCHACGDDDEDAATGYGPMMGSV